MNHSISFEEWLKKQGLNPAFFKCFIKKGTQAYFKKMYNKGEWVYEPD